MILEPIQYLLGALSGSLVGFTLGLVGGGGSILAVPLMVYLVRVPDAHLAIGTAEADIPLYANDRWLGFASKNLLPHANAIPNSADFGAYWTAMFKGLEASWTHTASVEDAVKNVEAEVVSALGDKIVVR